MPTVFRKLPNFIAVFHCRLLLGLLALALLLAGCNSGSSRGHSNSTDSVAGEPVVEDYTGPVDYFTAFRFLQHATFGPVPADIDQVMDGGIASWLEAQLAAPSAYDSDADERLTHLERLIQVAQSMEPDTDWFPQNDFNDSGEPYFNGAVSHNTGDYQMAVWFENAFHAPDQLRQRVAYALSQILVTSAHEFALGLNAESLAYYYDILARNALGNFRTLLGEMAHSPAMGVYLSHQGNQKANPKANTLPDENFARELMQLFTIGLYKLNLDGTPVRDGEGNLIPTYTQEDIEELARVMTGWDLRYNEHYGRTLGSYVHPMEFTPEQHDSGTKVVLGETISGGADGSDLEEALDILFQHPNAGPFIGRQLIQRLVTSNPSPAYIARVASVFNNNGEGVRGDLAAVVRAILLDEEARDMDIASGDGFGKAREHLLAFTSLYRAFDVRPLEGWVPGREEDGRPEVSGIYQFKIHQQLGQGPLRAHHVFNFYDPDFVPQDAFYRDSDPQRVLPEMQLRSPNNIATLFDLLRLRKLVLERNDLIALTESEEVPGSIEAYVAAQNEGFRWNGYGAVALLDYGPALQAFELAMEGDTNGNFALINGSDRDERGNTPKQRGLKALLDFLELRLLGARTLPDSFREPLLEHLDTDSAFNDRDDPVREAINVTAGSIQYLMLSSSLMAQQ